MTSQTSSTVATARRLAIASPASMLPCPLCVASVRADNLDKHLGKVHAGDGGGAEASAFTLRGADRVVGRELLVLLALALVVATAAIAWTGPALSTAMAALIGLPPLVLFVALLPAIGGLFRAQLEIDGTEIRLRYGLGLRKRTLTLAGPIEVGRLFTLRPDPVTSGYAGMPDVKVDAGMYLRISSEKRRISVGCLQGTGARKHWSDAGWRSGPKTRFWDITLDRASMVALEYALVERGVLRVREG